MFEVSSYLEQHNCPGDDALLLVERKGSIWFCIADGSGGSGYGAKASALIISAFNNFSARSNSCAPDDFECFLRNIDQEIQKKALGGESTAIVGRVIDSLVIGASVGDSEVWFYDRDYEYPLTSQQVSKPLLGSGRSIPVGFGPVNMGFALLMGSDGLFKYANGNDIRKAVRSGLSAKAISSLTKCHTGKLQDDISVIAVYEKSLEAPVS